MARTKGSRNKTKLTVGKSNLISASNFKSLEVKETKTEVYQVGVSKADIELFLKQRVKTLMNFNQSQPFEKEEIAYDNKGNAFITFTNPLSKAQLTETSPVSSEKK